MAEHGGEIDYLDPAHLFEHVQDSTFFEIPKFIAPRDPVTGAAHNHVDIPQWRESVEPFWRPNTGIPLVDSIVESIDGKFTKFMVLTSLAFTVGQFWILLQNYLRQAQPEPAGVPVARVADIPVGGAQLFDYPDEHAPRILVRLSDDEFVAYDQQCTHLLCPVLPEVEHGVMHCPCHEGYFDIRSGRPIAGPPRRPLARVTLEVRDGTVYAMGMTREAT